MIFNCTFNVWSPAIGDSQLMSWVIVALYFLAAVFVYFVQIRTPLGVPGATEGRHRFFWILIILLLLFLGVNKQLDLQSWFTAVAKCMAKTEGWYADRRKYQTIFIVALSFLFSMFLIFFAWYFRGYLRKNFFAILGVLVLLFFILIRASAIEKIDFILDYRLYDSGIKQLLEISGILLIFLQVIINFVQRDPNRHLEKTTTHKSS